MEMRHIMSVVEMRRRYYPEQLEGIGERCEQGPDENQFGAYFKFSKRLWEHISQGAAHLNPNNLFIRFGKLIFRNPWSRCCLHHTGYVTASTGEQLLDLYTAHISAQTSSRGGGAFCQSTVPLTKGTCTVFHFRSRKLY